MKENAAEFDTRQDDVFGRIASRYDMLYDLSSCESPISFK